MPPVNNPVEGPGLSVASAARRLGVAPATLRTWDRRYGMGPSEHTPGQHRRYGADDVARLELMQHALVRGAAPAEAAHYALAAPLPAPGADLPVRPRVVPSAAPVADDDPDGTDDGPDDPTEELGARARSGGRVLRLAGAGRRARGLGRAALSLDADAARTLLVESIAELGVVDAWDEVARPVLAAVAERWAYTGAGIEIEHMLSECVLNVFGAHATSLSAGETRLVLLAGMPYEQHTLPLAVLAAALSDRGVASRSLGANLPADALVAAVRRTAPLAVVLWSQMSPTADPEMLRSLPRTRPRFRTFVAGPGWAGVELPPRVVALESLGGAAAQIAAAAAMTTRPAAPGSATPPSSGVDAEPGS